MKAVSNPNPHRLSNDPATHLQQLQADLDAARDAVAAAAALGKLDFAIGEPKQAKRADA